MEHRIRASPRDRIYLHRIIYLFGAQLLSGVFIGELAVIAIPRSHEGSFGQQWTLAILNDHSLRIFSILSHRSLFLAIDIL